MCCSLPFHHEGPQHGVVSCGCTLLHRDPGMVGKTRRKAMLKEYLDYLKNEIRNTEELLKESEK
jgi:hypothetical protein